MAVRRFQTRPLMVDAIQLTWPNWAEIGNFVRPPWFGGGVYLDADGKKTLDSKERIGLRLIMGGQEFIVQENDWIIKDDDDQFFFCKSEIFEQLYELADDGECDPHDWVTPSEANPDDRVTYCKRCGSKKRFDRN